MDFDLNALGALFELSNDAVLGIKDNLIVFANPRAEDLLGAQTGQNVRDIVPAYILDDPSERFMATAVKEGRHGDVSVIRRGGISLLCWTFPQTESHTFPASGRMAQVLSETLSSIRLAFDAIVGETGSDADPRLRGYTAIVYRDYYRLQRLCRHLSATGNILGNTLPFSPQPIDLERVCESLCDTVSHFTASMGIALRFSGDDSSCFTLADKGLVEDMLLGLITNGLAHTVDGGCIAVGLKKRNNRFILSVDDNGSGIAPNDLSYIFETSRPADTLLADGGVGLGLGIVRGIAEKHGGALIMESRLGSGTSARVPLPIVSPDPSEAVFYQPLTEYGEGLDKYLTELSVVLEPKFFNKKLFD